MNETKKFPLISGNLSLDLVNTELVRRGQRHDLLCSEEDLLEWLHLMDQETLFVNKKIILNAGEKGSQVLQNVLEMRKVLREQFESVADGHSITEDFVVYLEKKIEQSPFTYKLSGQHLIPVPVGEIEDVLLSLIAYDTLTLIADNKLNYMKRCSNEDCVLLFLDESGRRKWCSMKICGNRKKAARFQSKKSEQA